jgi:hypothetical protein
MLAEPLFLGLLAIRGATIHHGFTAALSASFCCLKYSVAPAICAARVCRRPDWMRLNNATHATNPSAMYFR